MSSGKSSSGLNFGAVVSEFRSEQRLAVLNQFEARDGTVLRYRHYPSVSSTALILLHGSATDSKYLANFAHGLAEAGVATVYTPDMRGHGSFPARRGDIDYIEQLEDDLADLIGHIEANAELARVVVGGHSSGGGFAVRFAGVSVHSKTFCHPAKIRPTVTSHFSTRGYPHEKTPYARAVASPD